MYQAALIDRRNIEDVNVLADLTGGLIDAATFRDALFSGAYLDKLAANNREAWSEYRFDAVPSLVMRKKALRSVEDIGLTSDNIRRFLQQAGHP